MSSLRKVAATATDVACRTAGRRIGLIQLQRNPVSTVALGADRRPVAELLVGYGYWLYRPDLAGCLIPVTAPGFDADVFACPVLEDARL